jgi:hypothetical protein
MVKNNAHAKKKMSQGTQDINFIIDLKIKGGFLPPGLVIG